VVAESCLLEPVPEGPQVAHSPEEDPGNPSQSGTHKIVVTTFLNSELGSVGYDMMGYAEGPIIKVEDPE
jgi:hypothetical protein